MTAIFDYFQQYTKVLTTEPPKILDVDASYLRVFTDMVCVVDDSYSSRSVFLMPDAMECFTYIYPNRYCSAEQFDDFGKIMNLYYEYQLSSTGLFNELKNGQARNEAPVFPVYWYVIATMPMFEVPEQHTEEVEAKEAIEEAEAAKEVEEAEAVKEVKELDSDSDSDDHDSCKTVCPDDSDSDEYDSCMIIGPDDSDSSDDGVYVSPNVSFIDDDSDDFDY